MKEKLAYLFWQYLKNTSTEKELGEFLSYVKQAEYDQTLRDLIRDVYNSIHESDPSINSYIDEGGSLVLREESEPNSVPAFPVKERRRILSPAIVGLLLIVTGGLLWWKIAGSSRYKHLPIAVQSLTKKMTEASEQKLLILPDSTQVWLNGNSYLEFPDEFTGKKREVYLSGEAWFDVRHAEEIPFIIHTGKITTTVLGTVFNIKAYPYQQTVRIAVSKGKIKVSQDDSGQAVAFLQKGQELKYSNLDGKFAQKNIDTVKIASWQQGTIYYEDETLGDILQDLSHIYNVDITVADHSELTLKITTSFNRSIGTKQALLIISKLIDKRLTDRDGHYIFE